MTGSEPPLGAASTRAVHERELLAVLLDKAQRGQLRAHHVADLTPADFRTPHAAATFRALGVLTSRADGGPVDRHQLVSELVTRHRASRPHAIAYIAQLASSVPHQPHLSERRARLRRPARQAGAAKPGARQSR